MKFCILAIILCTMGASFLAYTKLRNGLNNCNLIALLLLKTFVHCH